MRNRTPKLWTILIACLLIAWPTESAAKTTLLDVRLGLHPAFTRVVLDCLGDGPPNIVRDGKNVWVIPFRKLITRVPTGKLRHTAKGVVRRITLARTGQSSALKIFLKRAPASVRTFTLDGTARGPEGYRIVLDFMNRPLSERKSTSLSKRSKTAPPNDSKQVPKEKDIEEKGATIVASTPLVDKTQSPSEKTDGSPEEISPEQVRKSTFDFPTRFSGSPVAVKDSGPGAVKESREFGPRPRIVKTIESTSLYAMAETAFEEARSDLASHADRIAELYKQALKEEPKSPRRPLALYRLGFLYKAAGKTSKAQHYFRQLIHEFPQTPLAGKAWLELGTILQKKGEHINALIAFRKAMEAPLEKEDRIRGVYLMGISYVEADDFETALQTFQDLLAQDPSFPTRFPEIYKYLGEAAFGAKKYAECREYLYRYLNLAPNVERKDLLLARIAESYLQEGKRDLADKIFAYIEAHYPGSEGDLIGQIRKAEYYETQGPELQEEAFEIYRQLAQRPLSEPLRHFIEFKLAYAEWKEGRYEESLSRIDAILKASGREEAFDEFRELRRKVVLSWAKEKYDKGDYKGVVELYCQDPFIFQSAEDIKVQAMLAECYEKLKYYPNALSLYESLEKKSPDDRWRYRIARCAFEMGHLDRAIRACEQISNPELEASKEELLGRAYAALKDHSKALKHLQRAIELQGGPKEASPDLLELYADALYQTGDYPEALEWSRKVLERISPKDGALFVTASILASRCYQKLGEDQKAIDLLEKAVPRMESEDLRNQLTYQMGLLLLETGNTKRAEEIFSGLLKSPKKLWKMAAQQQLDYLKLQQRNSKIF